MLCLCLFLFTLLLTGSSIAYGDDSAVAEWVLRSGGSVTVEGGSPIRDLQQLPDGPVRLRTVDIVSIVVAPAEFERFSAVPHLRELYLSGRTWHSMPNAVSAKSFSYLAGLTALEKLVLSLPVQTEIPLRDEAIGQLSALKNLREIRLAQTQVRGHTLAPFTNVEALNLNHTQLDDEGMASLAGMRRLYLRGHASPEARA